MGEKKRRMAAGGGNTPIEMQMPILEGFPEHVIDRLVERANIILENAREAGNANPRWFAEQLNAAEVIVCVYPDEDWNWSAAVVRGIRNITEVIKDRPGAPRAFYVRCWNRYDAVGYWTGFGDGRAKPGTPTAHDITPRVIQLYGGVPVEDRQGALIAANRDKNAAVAAGLGHGSGRDAWVQDAFNADLVLGVWEGTKFEGGIGIAMLKGKALLERVRINEGYASVTQTHILCANIGHADTLFRELGECPPFGSGLVPRQGFPFELPVRVTRYSVELIPGLIPDGMGGHQVVVASTCPTPLNDDARGGRA